MTHSLVTQVVTRLQKLLPESGAGLHEPCFQGKEWDYVKDCLDTGWVSTVGSYVDRFEADLKKYVGCEHVSAVVNGTAALHTCLKIAGVSLHDEVLVPTLTFVATANAVAYCGALPHFVDSEPNTLGIDPHKLERYLNDTVTIKSGEAFNKHSGRRLKALIVVHAFGHPAKMEELCALAERFRLVLIEDAAESLGSFYKGKHTGNFGLLSALSFNGNKIITTGGGGAVLTNNKELGQLAKHLTTTARVKHNWEYRHDQIGYNYRLPNINAALGCAQLEKLEVFIEKKRHLSRRYRELFADVKGISWQEEPESARSNFWFNNLLLEKADAELLGQLLDATNKLKFITRPVWTLLHKLEPYQAMPCMDVSCAEDIEQRLLSLPSSAFLG